METERRFEISVGGVPAIRGAGGDVTEEIVERIGARNAAREFDTREDDTNEAEHDSWVDAVVTLIAVVIFGLGWVLVELEGAEATARDYSSASYYDAAQTTAAFRVASLDDASDPSQAPYPETGWIDAPRKNSRP